MPALDLGNFRPALVACALLAFASPLFAQQTYKWDNGLIERTGGVTPPDWRTRKSR